MAKNCHLSKTQGLGKTKTSEQLNNKNKQQKEKTTKRNAVQLHRKD